MFSYGWAPELHIFPLIPSLRELNESFPFIYLVLADPEYMAADIGSLREPCFIELRYELTPMERIYTFLHASDAYLLHKQKQEIREGEVAVPSSILMCLGALTPVVTSDTEFVWCLEKEAMKYSNTDELREVLIKVFEGDESVQETLKSAEKYAIEHSTQKITGEFIKLFQGLR